jgi:hypothetical protein
MNSISSLASALWFAPRGIENEKNIYFRARRVVQFSEVPTKLPLQISAESFYRLWCNGIEVGSGPARGTHTLAFYDTYDLAPYLQTGENCIAVLVGCGNTSSFKTDPERPALYAQLEDLPDESWQVQVAEDFRRDVPLYTFQMGYMERCDLRQEPPAWKEASTQLEEWSDPEYFALSKQLLPRDIPMLQVSRHEPRLICMAAVPSPGDASDTAVAKIITEEKHKPLELKTLPLQLETEEGGISLLFDFEREITGGLQIELDAPEGTICDIGYEEVVIDGRLRVFVENEHFPHKSYAFADRFICRKGQQTLGATLQERGFRYVQIVLRNFSQPVTLCSVEAVDRRYPLEATQQFHSNDNDLQQLWDACVHTVSSCATDAVLDCPWRESAFWVCDFIVNAPFWLKLGGEPALISRGLRLSLSERNAEGLVYGVCPAGGDDALVFPATNTYLPLILEELSRYDRNSASELLPEALRVLESLSTLQNEDGLIVSPPRFWNFIDWSFPFAGWDMSERAGTTQNWFYVLSLDAAARLCDANGLDSKIWSERADNVFAALQRNFWDAERGVFREFSDEDKASKLAQSLALISGRCDGVRDSLLSSLQSSELLEPELYMMHFVLRALMENNEHNQVLERIRRYWVPIVQGGSPTIWEANVHQHGKQAFHGSGSLCHAFACSPLMWLPELANHTNNA